MYKNSLTVVDLCKTSIVWTTISHKNLFFCLYHQQNKSSASKAQFRQASNRCKKVLEAAKSAYGNKAKDVITSQKLGFCIFWWIAEIVFWTQLNLLYLLCWMNLRCCLLLLIKNTVCKNFSKMLNLNDSGMF